MKKKRMLAMMLLMAIISGCFTVHHYQQVEAKKKITIYLNPGHGKGGISKKERMSPDPKVKTKKAGSTSGTASRFAKNSKGKAIPEYQAVYDIAVMLKKELEKEGYRVIMCKSSAAKNMSNKTRTQNANKAKVDLHISLHMNGSTSSKVSGAFACLPKTVKNGPTSKVVSKSKKYANTIMKEYSKATGIKLKSNIESRNYTTLNYAKVPTFIFEMGHMTNKKEDKFMQSKSGRKKMVKGMVKGVKKALPIK